jgi:predicted ester cyclase
MTIEQTRARIEPYVRSHDPQYLAEDAVFIDTATGQRYEGRDAVAEMLHWIYHVAFDARAEDLKLIVGEGTAALEARFVGRHVGEFAGIPATGRTVRVPLCVTYDVAEDGVKEARIYMQGTVLMVQLGLAEPAAA